MNHPQKDNVFYRCCFAVDIEHDALSPPPPLYANNPCAAEHTNLLSLSSLSLSPLSLSLSLLSLSPGNKKAKTLKDAIGADQDVK